MERLFPRYDVEASVGKNRQPKYKIDLPLYEAEHRLVELCQSELSNSKQIINQFEIYRLVQLPLWGYYGEKYRQLVKGLANSLNFYCVRNNSRMAAALHMGFIALMLEKEQPAPPPPTSGSRGESTGTREPRRPKPSQDLDAIALPLPEGKDESTGAVSLTLDDIYIH